MDELKKKLTAEDLKILHGGGLSDAVMEFVEKGEKDAIANFVEKSTKVCPQPPPRTTHAVHARRGRLAGTARSS